VELLQTIGADEEAEIAVSGELPDTEFVIADSIVAAMANHIDLKDMRGQIERQERIVKEVIWELLPEFRTSYRYKDTSLILEQEGRTWDTSLAYDKPIWEKEGAGIPKRDKWEFSLGLGFPIFDGFRVKGVMQMEQARLDRLKTELLQREKRSMAFHLLFPEQASRRVIIITFLAILELVKTKLVRIFQLAYHDDFLIPGILPSLASSLKQIRQISKSRI